MFCLFIYLFFFVLFCFGGGGGYFCEGVSVLLWGFFGEVVVLLSICWGVFGTVFGGYLSFLQIKQMHSLMMLKFQPKHLHWNCHHFVQLKDYFELTVV